MHSISREIAKLIDLIDDPKRRGQRVYSRIIPVLDIDGDFLGPGVSVEIGADQVAVLRPGVERVGGAVDASESFAVPHKRHQVGFLLIAQLHPAAGTDIY